VELFSDFLDIPQFAENHNDEEDDKEELLNSR
jgi:hypothetical protein